MTADHPPTAIRRDLNPGLPMMFGHPSPRHFAPLEHQPDRIVTGLIVLYASLPAQDERAAAVFALHRADEVTGFLSRSRAAAVASGWGSSRW